jgi:O-antigen/teichoic acid export membrane protein
MADSPRHDEAAITRAGALVRQSSRQLAPLLIYSATVASTLLGGVALARGMDVADRGSAAILSVTSSLCVIWGTMGLPEYQLRQSRPDPLRASTRLRTMLCVAAAVVVGGAYAASVDRGLSVFGLMAYGLSVAISCKNSFALVRAQLLKGLSKTLLLQLVHAALMAGLMLALWWANSRISLQAVVLVWLCVEVFTATALELIVRGPGTVAVHSHVPLRAGLSHATAQTGAFLADRGLLFIVGLFAGTTAAGYMTVSQSSIAPLTLPVQAYSQKILTVGQLNAGGTPTGRRFVRLVMALSVLTAAAMALALGPLIELVFGPTYAAVAAQGPLLAAGGLALALWRIQHLRLRSSGRAGRATLSDLGALACLLGACFFTDIANTAAGVTWLLAGYGAIGLSLSHLVALARVKKEADA